MISTSLKINITTFNIRNQKFLYRSNYVFEIFIKLRTIYFEIEINSNV